MPTTPLKAYVRRTILAAARDYANGRRRTPESLRSAFVDATRGTDTGWWSDLIYTAPMLGMAHKYRRDIALAIEDYRDQVGESYSHNGCSDVSILAALIRNRPWTFEEYRDGPNNRDADAALLGLRFAVEWTANQLASEMGVEL